MGGYVVFIVFFVGLVFNVGFGVYGVVKYGVVGLVEMLVCEVIVDGIGVLVFCLMVVEINLVVNFE